MDVGGGACNERCGATSLCAPPPNQPFHNTRPRLLLPGRTKLYGAIRAAACNAPQVGPNPAVMEDAIDLAMMEFGACLLRF